MSKVKVNCDNANCKKEFLKSKGEFNREFLKSKGEFNRSEKIGRKHYCCRSCYGHSDDNVGFDNVSEEAKKKNTENIKKHCGNLRDEYTPFRYFVKVSKNGGRKQDYDLDLDYLMGIWKSQNGICPLSGYSLLLPLGTHGWGSDDFPKRASLDRINPKKGYIKGNVRFISWTANIALSRVTDQELIDFCKDVAKYNK
jgi:hypothetical protein